MAKGPLGGPFAAGSGDQGFERLALILQGIALVVQASDQGLERLALVLQRGHGLSMAAFGLCLLALHEITLEPRAPVVGLHHARDAVVDNADLASADDVLGSEQCDFKMGRFSVSK